MPATPNSPFNWRAQPSVLANDPDINGINHRKSQQATALKKAPFILNGVDPRTPHNQISVCGRAVVAKSKDVYGL